MFELPARPGRRAVDLNLACPGNQSQPILHLYRMFAYLTVIRRGNYLALQFSIFLLLFLIKDIFEITGLQNLSIDGPVASCWMN
jgi:hypothetical protein